MQNYLLTCLCNVFCAFVIVLCGREALETTNFLLCVLYWFGVYFTLDFHTYLINYLRDSL